MMFRRYSNVIATIVLCFFTWTSGGVSSIANAAQDAIKKENSEKQQSTAEGPEERFARATEELQEALADPNAGIETKKQKLKDAKAEIEAIEPGIRQHFADTGKKLKDAKLPDEILQRHYKFVKRYDDNLAELKGSIGRIENAKNKAEAEAEIDKANKFLQKVKAPKKHVPLDPNNLPHRQRKAKKLEPRLKKEEFEKDIKKKVSWKGDKRIMVASAGSLAGVLTSSTVTAVPPLTKEPAGPADLAETIEVQLTPQIRAKAQELEYKPLKIYEWVRNNIEFVPTWGSIQGANMTLLTKQGNAIDTASLLIALLRASGIHARYVTGTIQLPIESVMNWAGGFTDPMAALDFMSSGGIPTKALVSGNNIFKAQMEHVWVEAWINYFPSRGAKHINGKGDTWISLDPSYKQNINTDGIDIKAADPSVPDINVLGSQQIVEQEFPYLLGTLPYRGAIRGASFAEIPDAYRHKLSFHVENDTIDISSFDPDGPSIVDTSINVVKTLPELAGKKITLSYSPATAQDEAVINSYLPKPHPDGTPIQSNELPSSLPAYLIKVKPELRLDGQVVATGAPVGLGGTNIFTMNFSDPTYGSSQVINYIDAGVYQAIGLNLGRISQDQQTALKAKLVTTKAKLMSNDLANLSKDDLLGDLLYTTAVTYLADLETIDDITANALNVNNITLPSETIFATKLRVLVLWGIPMSVQAGGLNMDADYLMKVVKAKDGNIDRTKQFMLVSGSGSSELENSVPEQLFSTPSNPVVGISAVKALRIAADNNIPIYTIDQQNIAATLPQLHLSQAVLADIQNAVAAGKVVTAPITNTNYLGWTGCGYIITDPETGAGAYMISNGSNGAAIMTLKDMFVNFSAWVDAWRTVSGYWGDVYSQFVQCTDTDGSHECPCGRWYGYGADFQGNIIYGGNISLTKYVCLSKRTYTCTTAASCFTEGPDLDVGINANFCAVRNSFRISDFPNTMNITVGIKGYVGGGASFDENLNMICGSVGFGVGGGLKYNLVCDTIFTNCDD